jgi:hypothetical protein
VLVGVYLTERWMAGDGNETDREVPIVIKVGHLEPCALAEKVIKQQPVRMWTAGLELTEKDACKDGALEVGAALTLSLLLAASIMISTPAENAPPVENDAAIRPFMASCFSAS